MKKSLLPSILLFFFSLSICAQQAVRCASEDYKQQQLALHPELQQEIDAEEQIAAQFAAAHPNGYQSRSVITIPVIFHVVYQTAAQNLSNLRITEQIDALNRDYRKLNADANLVPAVWQNIAADCEINFCMAHRDPNGNWTDGIERRLTTVASWSTDDAVKFTASGGLDAWDRSKYLNIWVCNLSGFVLGYSSIPSSPANVDGVVLDYEYTGTTGATTPYHLGRSGTHEVGHWLNLIHVWGDDGSSCTGDDLVPDTPNQAGENYGCPSFPRTDACSSASPGVMFMNYMDYTDDPCMFMFTEGQKLRMWALMSGTRLPLQTSNVCTPTGISPVHQSVFSIAPSPSGGAFTLTFGNALPQQFDIFIYNVLGEQVFNQHYDALNEAELHLDLFGNPPGIYLVEVRTSTARTTEKIVLE
jgi:hypothetical protein